ncbi:MAG: PilZ domain-containing protein [Spirochaetales bacterium]|nr:PilZ domain-containing protein [Spirochaetales bacterium]
MVKNVLGICLQTQYRFINEPDPTSIIITVSILVGLILFVIIATRLQKNRNVPNTAASRNKFNKSMFKKMAVNYGFSLQQIKLLEKLISMTKVKHPLLIFSNTRALDDMLKSGIYSIEQDLSSTDKYKEDYINAVFEIKQTIDRHFKRGIGIRSTHFLKTGQILIITSKEGLKVHSKVITNRSDGIICSFPTTSTLNALVHRGQDIKVFFWRDNDSGYSFRTHVLSSENSQGLPTVSLQHARKLNRVQQRRFNRKPLGNSCFFYPVELLPSENKRDTRKRIVVHDERRHLGVVSDISAGGCRIISKTNYNKGSYIKLEFDIMMKTSITAIGKVQGAKRESQEGVAMHIVFKKISKKNLNHIYSYVFNYI